MLAALAMFCSGVFSGAEQPAPSIELLEFLGLWQEQDGTPIDPEIFDAEHADKSAEQAVEQVDESD